MSSAYRNSPPALVLGGPWVTTLCVIRNLGRKGIRQFAVGTGESFVASSRWHRRLPASLESQVTPDTLPQLLAAASCERMVLFPCSDDWTLAASDLEPALAAQFPAIVASRDTVETLIDKGRFARMLQYLALPHPRMTGRSRSGSSHGKVSAGSWSAWTIFPALPFSQQLGGVR